jgi:hypothetical protein
MTAALFGLAGVIVGGVLNGTIARALELSRQRATGVVAARLVHHELTLIRSDFELWLEGDRPPHVPVYSPMWHEHRVTLARVLEEPEWDMVSASYTWVDLHNADPPIDDQPAPDDTFWKSVVIEMRGGEWALKDYLGGFSRRELRRLRQMSSDEREQYERGRWERRKAPAWLPFAR